MIIDTNIATYWFVETPLSGASRELLKRADLTAPSLIKLEVASALLKFLRSKLISERQLILAMEQIDRTHAEFVDCSSLLRRAIEISISNRHKIYDCLYLALAVERAETLATADKRLAAAAKALSIETQLIEPAR
jgi:predicted nucleic acid-binding protein